MDNQYEIRVYKIWFNGGADFYIGSTKSPLSRRMGKHRSCMRIGSTCRLHNFMRENNGVFNYGLIASCMVSNKDEQNAFEQRYIDQLRPNLNTNRAHNTPEQRIEYQRQYRAANRENINERNRQYKMANREIILAHAAERVLCLYCDKHTSKGNLSKHKKAKTHIKKMNEYYQNFIYS